jgi:hypothetical protein
MKLLIMAADNNKLCKILYAKFPIFSYMSACNITFASVQTFFQYQRDLFVPAVHYLWNKESASCVEASKRSEEVNLAGDARYVTDAHSLGRIERRIIK